ncbi:MAG TPA: type 2 lanthipeptide synthetase LanM family protein, partial [Ktedonobacteraceae bacterium]|nr:type 2 lanthipeptide synthetase LanM family protein [Ktedonobacteraceae bacterium]
MIEILSNSRDIQHHPAWYAALTLSERLTTLQTPVGEPENRELAQQRLDKWKQQAPFGQEALFSERLAQARLSEHELRYLLGESPTSLLRRTEQIPTWLTTLLQAYADDDQDGGFEFPGVLPKNQLSSFLLPFKPLLKQGYSRLLVGIKELVGRYNNVPLAIPDVADFLFPHLTDRLLNVLVKPLTLELNIARLQNTLPGETSEQRFQTFIEHISQPDVLLPLLELYPVLARELITIIEYWVIYGLELLAHLCQDWEDIKTTFQQDPGVLAKIDCGTGDTHRRGRSVTQLTFSSGLKLVYKPRSLATDQHFQILLTWLNEHGDHTPLRAVTVLNRGDHGWSEFIEARECTSEAEIIRFYRRLGGYMALLYTLTATDMHFENLIACGEYPMLIDLESLFQPLQPDTRERKIPYSLRMLETSVLRSGMLPRRILLNAQAEGIDVSGLGGQAGQVSPHPVTLLAGIGTDEMHFIRQHITMGGRQNRPGLRGVEANPLDYIEQIITGFEQIYLLLLRHREEFLATMLPLFAQDEIRVILRPTRTYGRVLQESMHPTLLRNMLHQQRFLDHLWSAVPYLPHYSRIIHGEQQDLLSADIPLFTTFPSSCDLFTSQDDCIPGFFQEPAMTVAERCIRQMNERDLAQQCWIIRASFASTAMERDQRSWKGSLLLPTQKQVDRQRLLQAARTIGDRLCERAISDDEEVSWFTIHLLGERSWAVFITGTDLYSGDAGICLFLAYLGALSGDRRYTELARRTLNSIRQKINEQQETARTMLGGFDGWGAILYLYAHLGALWREPVLFAEAETFLDRFVPHIESDETLDIIGGTAGCILGLLALHCVAPSSRLLQAAIRCGDHLLAQAQQRPEGVGWNSSFAKNGNKLLTGFSHGAAGIAFSLLELAEASR